MAEFEGFRAAPYQDDGGVWTIGYGETEGIGPGTPPRTREQALAKLRARLDEDFLPPVLAVAKQVGLKLTQAQADALASFTYNLGPRWLNAGYKMGDALRSQDRLRIADAFLLYNKVRDKTGRVISLPGLTRRRNAERAMFLSG